MVTNDDLEERALRSNLKHKYAQAVVGVVSTQADDVSPAKHVDDAGRHDSFKLVRDNRVSLLQRSAAGILVGLGSFAILGTVAAIWANPLFVRMTPVQGFEIPLLALMSSLLGIYAAVRRRACGNKMSGLGGVVGFLGIACPICNKVLLLVFGGELLLAYLEPYRLWVSLLGIALVTGALARELWRRSRWADRNTFCPLDRPPSAHQPATEI